MFGRGQRSLSLKSGFPFAKSCRKKQKIKQSFGKRLQFLWSWRNGTVYFSNWCKRRDRKRHMHEACGGRIFFIFDYNQNEGSVKRLLSKLSRYGGEYIPIQADLSVDNGYKKIASNI